MVGECVEGREALRLVEEVRPDLVVLDLGLTDEVDGIELCRRIKSLPEAPYLLVYTDHTFAESISPCLLAGVDSYLHKRSTCEEFLDAIRRTVAGERVWKIEELLRETEPPPCIDPDGTNLTLREQEVLALKLRRRTNAEIAAELYISVHTVKHHVTSIYRKRGRAGKDLLGSQLRL